jgi:ribokinase
MNAASATSATSATRKVVVVGSANVDAVIELQRFPVPGETVLGRTLQWLPGGKGANQAVAACRLGVPTVAVMAVGDDEFGRQVLATLDAEGADTHYVRPVAGPPTGLAVVSVDDGGENTIVVVPGANASLAPSDVDGIASLLQEGDVLLLQLEVPVETSRTAAAIARDCGARVLLNAAPLGGVSAPLDDLLALTDVLILNETEARLLAGVPDHQDDADWSALAAQLSRRGPQAVVLTLGEDGAVVHGPDGGWHQSAFATDVVDTTGAGDAFCGAVAAALAQAETLPVAVRRGCAAGAFAVTKAGAQRALPSAQDVEGLMGGVS